MRQGYDGVSDSLTQKPMYSVSDSMNVRNIFHAFFMLSESI